MKVSGKRRILEIYVRLQNGKGINKEEMAREYNVSTRSIQRDLFEIDEVVSDPCFAEGGLVYVKYDQNSKKYYLSKEDEDQLFPEESLAG